LISESRKRSALPFPRFEELVHRFYLSIAMTSKSGSSWARPSTTTSRPLKGVARLRERRGGKFQVLNLGGLRIRRVDELVAWLEERRAAGITDFTPRLRATAKSMTDGMGEPAISTTRCRSFD
jgi:hypothetical protein